MRHIFLRIFLDFYWNFLAKKIEITHKTVQNKHSKNTSFLFPTISHNLIQITQNKMSEEDYLDSFMSGMMHLMSTSEAAASKALEAVALEAAASEAAASEALEAAASEALEAEASEALEAEASEAEASEAEASEAEASVELDGLKSKCESLRGTKRKFNPSQGSVMPAFSMLYNYGEDDDLLPLELDDLLFPEEMNIAGFCNNYGTGISSTLQIASGEKRLIHDSGSDLTQWVCNNYGTGISSTLQIASGEKRLIHDSGSDLTQWV
jgi:hypothetical protein